jgi:hypothetical protein
VPFGFRAQKVIRRLKLRHYNLMLSYYNNFF